MCHYITFKFGVHELYFIQNYAFIFYLDLIRPRITKQDTVMRQAIPAEERLIATLRFLATGRSYEDLKFSTGIAAQTLGSIYLKYVRLSMKYCKTHI